MRARLKRPAAAAGVFALLICGFAVWRAATNGYVGVPGDAQASPLAASPMPLTRPTTLRVATFNIQALWVVGRDRPARMRAIAERMAALNPDIVGFQEAFVPESRKMLIDALNRRTRLTHHAYFPSGNVGSGLLVSSAHPIAESWFHRFTHHGPLARFWEGDGLAGKGVALARIMLPEGVVDFFNTHAQAGYGNRAYDMVRNFQMGEAAEFIRSAGAKWAPALFVGDLNCRTGDEEYETAVRGAALARAMTVDSGIDHILAVDNGAYRFETLETVRIEEEFEVDGRRLELSDHPGFLSVIRITPEGV